MQLFHLRLRHAKALPIGFSVKNEADQPKKCAPDLESPPWKKTSSDGEKSGLDVVRKTPTNDFQVHIY